MPRPPKPDEFQQINFITNYFLLGCGPPDAAFFEFAREPALDLAFLLFAPDLFDIGQELLDPNKGRRRKPARHGRKRPRLPGLPDTSSMIGGRLNQAANIGGAIRLTPLRWILPLYNIYEGVTFTVAVLEGVTNTAFEGILGVVTVDNNECNDLDLLRREVKFGGIAGGPGIGVKPVFVSDLIRNKGFFQDATFCRSGSERFEVVFSATVRATSAVPNWEVSLALGDKDGTILEQSKVRSTPDTTPITMDISATFEPGETCTWGLGDSTGFFEILEANVLAYSVAGWPWSM